MEPLASTDPNGERNEMTARQVLIYVVCVLDFEIHKCVFRRFDNRVQAFSAIDLQRCFDLEVHECTFSDIGMAESPIGHNVCIAIAGYVGAGLGTAVISGQGKSYPSVVSFRRRTFLLRLLPCFLRGVTACLVVAACLILLISPSAFHGKCARNIVNWQAERDNGSRAECPRRMRPSSPGGPKGVITSHGTSSAYQRWRCVCQGAATGMANLSLQRLRAAISGSELQPILLSRAGMSE